MRCLGGLLPALRGLYLSAHRGTFVDGPMQRCPTIVVLGVAVGERLPAVLNPAFEQRGDGRVETPSGGPMERSQTVLVPFARNGPGT